MKFEKGRDDSGARLIGYETVRGSKKDAQVRLTEILESRNKGSFVDRTAMTVGDYLGRWLADLARCNLRDALKMLGAKKRGGDRKRVDQVAVGDAHRTLLGLLASDGSSPSQHVAREEIQLAIEQAIERLPDAYRKVVQMYDIHGQTVDEVADALNRSVGAVYMLRARAHHRLHGILGATTNFFSDSA
ncbi:MAG: sigma-70 family RNA polymerase sigma factor [Planctomycetes bacterium]|nr:sigma-70 family RNA polymerase sigma factor [Planctomycetota bacterium]